MTEEAGLNNGTDGNPGGSGAGNDEKITTLEASNTQLSKDLNEQRTIQAGLDRTVSQRDAKIQELNDQLSHYKARGGILDDRAGRHLYVKRLAKPAFFMIGAAVVA